MSLALLKASVLNLQFIRYGLESTIFLKAVESQVDFVYEEEKCKLTVGRVTLQMFDRVIVQVCSFKLNLSFKCRFLGVQ